MDALRVAGRGLAFYASVERFGRDVLLPGEVEYVERACKKRVGDFATGRYCARRALEQLGRSAVPIAMAPSRAPVWPNGFIGSITHTDGYAAAVVARRDEYDSVGFDAQRVREGRITQGMERLILNAAEYELIDSFGDPGVGLHLVFSIKEALYKCLNPLVNRFFGFEGAEVTAISPPARTFTVGLTSGLDERFGQGFHVEGLYDFDGDLVSTLVLLPRSLPCEEPPT